MAFRSCFTTRDIASDLTVGWFSFNEHLPAFSGMVSSRGLSKKDMESMEKEAGNNKR